MDIDKLISHTIHIAGEQYPVRLTEAEKELAGEIEREIKQKIADFRVKYMVKSTQDVLAMILLTYAFDAKMGDTNNTSPVDEANKKVQRLLEVFASIEKE